MRPAPIIWFERLIFASLLIGVFHSYLTRDELLADASGMGFSPLAFVVIVQLVVVALVVWLTLLVSRRRSKVAMWISIVLFLVGLPFTYDLMASESTATEGLVLTFQAILGFLAYGLLFTPKARAWMNRTLGLNDTLVEDEFS